MPKHLTMSRLFLDRDPHAFAVTIEGDKTVVSVYASARFGPFRRDVIGMVHPCYIRADVNGDDHTNILDIIHVRNHLGRPASDWESESADVNADGAVNILDLIAVRNHLNQEPDLTAPDACPITVCGPQIKLRYEVRNCGTPSPPIEPEVSADGNRMIVTDAIYFNCCTEYVRMTILVQGNNVVFREKAMLGAPCDCICYYPMKGVAGPFEPGVYHVELVDPQGAVILAKDVEIK